MPYEVLDEPAATSAGYEILPDEPDGQGYEILGDDSLDRLQELLQKPSPVAQSKELTVSGVLKGGLETLMTPIVEFPAVPGALMQGVLNPLLPGDSGAKIAEGAGRFVSKAASSITAPGMVGILGLSAVAPPAGAAIIAGLGAHGIGPAAVEAVEASKRGDLAGFTESTLDTAMAGVMAGGGARGVIGGRRLPRAAAAIETLAGRKPPVLPVETAVEAAIERPAGAVATPTPERSLPVHEGEIVWQSTGEIRRNPETELYELFSEGEKIADAPTFQELMARESEMSAGYHISIRQVGPQRFEILTAEVMGGDPVHELIPFAKERAPEARQIAPVAEAVSVTPDVPVTPAEPQAAGPSRPGPMLTPTPPAAAIPATPPKALSQVIRDLSEGLATPIRFGRLIAKKAGGYFLPTQNLIATKFANDIVVTSHEVGHKVDSLINLRSNPTVATELMFLGDNARPGSMSSWTTSKTIKYRKGEGVAEFMRYWLTDPAEATRLAPQTAALFEATITTLPDVNKMLRQARDDIALWRASEPQARLRSQISVGEQSSTRYDLSDLTRDIVDDLHYLKLATDDVTKLGGVGLSPSKNPYLLARLTRGAYGEADAFIKSGSIDFRTREVSGPGLKQILEPVGPRIADFRDYIVSRQAKEMRTQGKETGLLPGDVDFVVSKFQNDAAFNTAFDGLKQWSDSLVKYAVDSGYLSADAAAAMRNMNREYVPMHRIFEVGAGELGQQGGASGRGMNAVKSAFKGRHGSRRDIVDPLETYVKNTYAILLNADKNAVNIALADFAKLPGMGKWVEPIATPKEVQKVGIAKIREELEANGADLTGVPNDLLLTFWKDSNRAPVGENAIKVNRAGKLEFYRLNEDLYRTVQALDSESAGTLLKILSAPAQILRAGATLTPDFAISNAMRDTLTSSIISRYGTFPVEHTLRGLYSLLKDPKTVAEFRASGGAQSIEAHYFDRAALQNFLKENVSTDFSYGDYAKFIAKSPLTALRLLSGTFEEATRIGEYQRVFDRLVKDGYNAGEARRLAAFEARDLQDFAMGGAKTKGLRRVTAFWNAALQGNYRLYQSLKDPETRMATMAKATAFVTIPTLTLFAINKDDPDYWDKPQWARDLFWLIPRGKDDLGHTKFLHIPKPFGIGLLFGTVPERALQSWFKEDPDAFKDLPKQVANATVPNPIPQALNSIYGAFLSGDQGYDLFRGRSIVPDSMEDFPAELQFTEQTSLTAKRVGEAIGLSPMKIDFLINQTGGGLARQGVNQGVDRVLSWVTGDERTARSTYPGARFAGLPSGVQSAAVEKFYERLKELRQEGKRRDVTGKGEDRFLGMAENTARRLSLLRKQQLRTKDETERQKISLEMREAAERTLQLMKERADAP